MEKYTQAHSQAKEHIFEGSMSRGDFPTPSTDTFKPFARDFL